MAAAGWKTGDIIYQAESDTDGRYSVYRYRTAGGKLYRDVAYAGIVSHSVAERYAAQYQQRVDAGMAFQEAER